MGCDKVTGEEEGVLQRVMSRLWNCFVTLLTLSFIVINNMLAFD